MSLTLTKIRGNTQIMDATILDAQIAASADIQTSKLADGSKLIFNDGTRSFTSTISGVTPTLAAHLATKGYVDSVATGLDVKLSVRAISTTDITLSGTQTVDGVALIADDRILVAGQTDATQNGIYDVKAGAWVRSSDADNSPAGEVTSGMFTFVEEGGTFGGSGWVLATANPITLDTTELVFVQFSQAGVIEAGAGLTKSGNTIDVVSANGGIVVNVNSIELTLDGSTLSVGSSGLKLADLASGNILIGNGSNVATAHALSGDVTMTNAGVVTISNGAITNAKITDGTITLAKLASSSTSGQMIVTNGSNVPSYVTMSGDATVSSTGAITIESNAVTTSKIADANVTLAKIQSLDATKFIIGTASGNNTQVAMSGDATMTEAGVVTVDSSVVVKVADIITRETPSGTQDGTNPTFVLANVPKLGTEHVFVNGLLQDAGGSNDYTISGDTITFAFNPEATDKIRVSYFK